MKIVIIGAGIAGLSIGWRLAQAGAAVAVLERAQPGQGATAASAGMISPVAEQTSGGMAEFGRRSAQLWPAFAAKLEAQSGIAPGYIRDGAWLVALDETEATALSARAAQEPALESIDVPVALAMEPMLSPKIVGAWLAAEEARVDSRSLGPALARAFMQAGGALQRNEAAVRFEMEGDRVTAVLTPFHKYHADAFVIAAGAWSSQFAGLPADCLPDIKPIKGEMIAYAAPDGVAGLKHVVWGHDIYLVPRGKQILVGATVEDAGFDSATTIDAHAWLRTRASMLAPALAGLEVADHWAGLRPFAPDGMPVLGRTKIDGLFIASGQYRNGILFAPMIADGMCRFLLEGQMPEELQAFSPDRFG